MKAKRTGESFLNVANLIDGSVIAFKEEIAVSTLKNEVVVKKEKYQVGLSFAGEDRFYVSQVAEELKKLEVKVFYDTYEQVNLWGKDLYQHLSDVYKNKCQYCVIFISKYYAENFGQNMN